MMKLSNESVFLSSIITSLIIYMYRFSATLHIVGINPFVFIPDGILYAIFNDAAKDKSPIPVMGTVNGKPYKQSLMKHQGQWRLYINMFMLKNSPKRIGEEIHVEIAVNDKKEELISHPLFTSALKKDKQAQKIFEALTPSLQKEITRYINHLKTEDAIRKNVKRAIAFLKGEERFIGRPPLKQ